ncbi:MAG: DUF2769 domain-containing protein [Thermoleophilia bacterium]
MKEVHVSLHNIRNCICGNCPSFPGKLKELAHAEMPGLFCAHGKSRLKIDQRGCICGDCDVQIEHELTGDYYCVRGKAEEL